MTKRLRTVAILTALAGVAWIVAERNGILLFPPHRHDMSHVTLGIVVLLVILALSELQLRSLSLEERRKLWARQVIPEAGGERAVWLISAILAGAAEEIIFRGALFAFLTVFTRSIVIAAVISAIVFAFAHFRQGWKNMSFVAAIALLFQWLVISTASLLPAIVVHAIYNIARGVRATRAIRS